MQAGKVKGVAHILYDDTRSFTVRVRSPRPKHRLVWDVKESWAAVVENCTCLYTGEEQVWWLKVGTTKWWVYEQTGGVGDGDGALAMAEELRSRGYRVTMERARGDEFDDGSA